MKIQYYEDLRTPHPLEASKSGEDEYIIVNRRREQMCKDVELSRVE